MDKRFSAFLKCRSKQQSMQEQKETDTNTQMTLFISMDGILYDKKRLKRAPKI